MPSDMQYASVRPRTSVRRGVHYRAAYLPETEFVAAHERGLLDATVHREHADYRRELELSQRHVAEREAATIWVVPLDVDGLVAYAQRKAADPVARQTRLDYTDSLYGAGRDVAWPPPRNAPCWCGSERKYKKCCGAPAFLAAPTPDPAAMIVKIELDGVEPPVWRRVAIPSELRLDQVHRLVQDAMGWDGRHAYLFEAGEVTVFDPQLDAHGYEADAERFVSVANAVADQLTYVYDLGDYWSHTLTVEEIQRPDDDNVPWVLGGAGACPPDDCGGAGAYSRLLRAHGDPTDPDHDDALDRLGADFVPSRYELPAPQPTGPVAAS